MNHKWNAHELVIINLIIETKIINTFRQYYFISYLTVFFNQLMQM